MKPCGGCSGIRDVCAVKATSINRLNRHRQWSLRLCMGRRKGGEAGRKGEWDDIRYLSVVHPVEVVDVHARVQLDGQRNLLTAGHQADHLGTGNLIRVAVAKFG